MDRKLKGWMADGWEDVRMDGWMDGIVKGLMDGWACERMDV